MSESDIHLSDAEEAALPQTIDSRHDEDDRLRPEFVQEVVEKAEAGDAEAVRALVEPLHPADLWTLDAMAMVGTTYGAGSPP